MSGLNVVSLFDGMSCLAIALKEINIPVEKYYASEIDKYAIAQTQLNFPETIQLGDVTKWREWDIDWSKIDLIGSGSPCQGFSFSGKQLAFDDPRSKLFFMFVDILNYCKKYNPDVKFLLENVDMKKDYLRIISEYVGVFPVNINSNLVSAQNRSRNYWTNIRTKTIGLFDDVYSDIPIPVNLNIVLNDILEKEVDNMFFLGDKQYSRLIKAGKKATDTSGKAKCLTGSSGHGQGNNSDMNFFCVAQRGRGKNNIQQLEVNHSGKSNCLTTASKDNLLQNASCIRRLTPGEHSDLQTIPRWYKWNCSNTQIYKMTANGWTIKIISHILSFL
jgi:DNA (cytosine-5)-methyltransferase 3A